MKTKNVILGLCALVFAIGSAFATLDSNSLANEQVRITTSASIEGCVTATLCQNITASCSGTGFNCKATVNSTGITGGSALANVRDGLSENCGTIKVAGSESSSGSLTNNCVVSVQ